jgi:cytochrome P450
MTVTASLLATQIRGLLAEATPKTVPSGVLAWWGRTAFPDGGPDAPALSQQQWEGLYLLLENAAVQRGVVRPLPAVQALTRDLRPDGPLPIAIASFELAVPRPELVDQVRAGAAAGKGLSQPPPNLASATEQRRAFIASGLMHDQWGMPAPVYRGRRVEFLLDQGFHFTNPGAPLPDAIEVDPGDGGGFRAVFFGTAFAADYPEGDTATVTLRCRYGDVQRTARFLVAFADRPAPPAPDEVWPLVAAATDGRPGNTGRAYVYRAPDRTEIRHPIILVEGFPGGRPYDWLYEMLNAAGTLDGLRELGYDVIFVGLDMGLDEIQRNAGVLIECMREATRRTPNPLAVGGVSMGGLVSRYALALMEHEEEPHNTRSYVSIDTPHGGAYTSLGVQWFVQSLLPFSPALAGFEALLDSPSNQQMMLSWLHDDGTAGISPLRAQLLEDLERIGGWPKQPRKLAVSCGRGDGKGDATPGARTLGWDGEPFVSATLNTLPGVDGVVAEGSWFLNDPPQLSPLMVGPDETPWESAPGGQNTYNGDVAAIATAFGCGSVEHDLEVTCSVPTVSALGLTQDPFEPVPDASANAGPFDAYACNAQNERHLQITPEVSAWLLGELGAPEAAGGQAPAGGNPGHDGFDPSTFDPHDPGFLADPYPVYAQFRAEAPVFQVMPYGSYWVFRHADVQRMLTETDTFVKNSTPPPDPKPGPIGAMRFLPQGLFSSDPPRHTGLRELLEPLFDDAIANGDRLVSGLADPILEQARQTGRMELVSDYAVPVPSGVLFSILGIAPTNKVWQGLVSWVTAIVAAHDIRQSMTVQWYGATSLMALNTFIDGLIHQNLRDPQPGLLGAMCGAITDDFTADDVQACCADFLVAGYLSTTFLICSGTRHLLENGDQAEALARDPSLWKNALEEMLRFDAPAQLVDRVVAADTELGGVNLAAGSKVTAVLGSADHDPDAFANPETFRIDRDDREQVSFGAGIHHCIGAPLVRLAAPVAIRRLMDLDGLAVDGLAQWQTDPYLRGMVNLPLRFDA